MVRYNIYILLLFTCGIWSQKLPDHQLDSILSEGIYSIIKQDYNEAQQKFSLLNNKYPENPLGNIYSAVVLITESVDLGEELNDTLINHYFDASENQISNLNEIKHNNVWNNYYLALLKGYKAYFNVLNKNYLPALSNGFSSVEYFEKCITDDSTFYESLVALGTFKYWKSEKTEFLNWLPFYTDEKETGIDLLKKGLQLPSYNYYLGFNSLIWIWINQKNYAEAIKLCNEALKNYPDNRNFKWCLAEAYENTDKKKSLSVYKELLASYLSIPSNNHFNEVILKQIIAKLYLDLGETELALKQCNEILSIKFEQNDVLERLDERLESVKKLRMKLMKGKIPLNDK